MRYGRTVAGVAAAVVVVDAVTKALAASALAGRGAVHVAGDVHLLLYRNHGGPGGTFPDQPVLVSGLVIVALACMIWAIRLVDRTWVAVVLGLMLGGGIGNLLDRLLRSPGPLRGGVIDWIQLQPGGGSMNLADLSLNLAVVVGAVALLAGAIRGRASARGGPAATPE